MMDVVCWGMKAMLQTLSVALVLSAVDNVGQAAHVDILSRLARLPQRRVIFVMLF